ncbi:MAG: aldehyde dehydrogenase family protein [Nitrospirae bacterium]|nr:aldehyde dehydrogenase family protein [Nitrospirota bacterium]
MTPKIGGHMDKIVVTNPATLEKLAEVEIWDAPRVEDAVRRAARAFDSWHRTSFRERRRWLLRLKDEIIKRKREIAEVIVKENGKPFVEALAYDVMPVLEFLTYFAQRAEDLLRKELLDIGKWKFMRRESYLEFAPLGVVGVISPWNFPFSLSMGPIAQALMAGNTVVLKPSELTTLTGLKIADLFRDAGLPQDIVIVAPGDGRTGDALVRSSVRKIVFTGSTATGKKIMSLAGQDLKPVVMELGGKDPMILLKDAHLPTAIKAAVWGAYVNCGQVCCSVERLYVHKNIYKEVLDGVVAETNSLRQGNGMDPETDIGPLISERQLRIVESQVDEARKKGARILAGGERNRELKGWFYKPTVLTDVTPQMQAIRDETFGPTLPVIPFESEDEALSMANDSPYGLTASIWTANLARARELASRLEYGSVSINDHGVTYGIAQTPWGGWKQSGIGRTHGSIGIREMVEIRHVHTNRGFRMSNPMWFKYDRKKSEVVPAALDLLYGRGVRHRVKGLMQALRRASS